LKKYTVLQPVKHDGDRHEPGSVVSMADKHAAPLVHAGVLVELKLDKGADKPTQAQLDADVAAAVKATEAALAVPTAEVLRS
jgi:predicted phage tail protein